LNNDELLFYTLNERYKYKICKCPKKYWEIIIYDRDEEFGEISTIRYHCDLCGRDYVIEKYNTNENI
jgi:hypothetical protein